MTTVEFERETKALIDSLKSICTTYGLGGRRPNRFWKPVRSKMKTS